MNPGQRVFPQANGDTKINIYYTYDNHNITMDKSLDNEVKDSISKISILN